MAARPLRFRGVLAAWPGETCNICMSLILVPYSKKAETRENAPFWEEQLKPFTRLFASLERKLPPMVLARKYRLG